MSEWPKTFSDLTEEQIKIRNDFMYHWHQILPQKYGLIERFNHSWGIKNQSFSNKIKTLEIGAGLGAHIEYENLENQDYFTLELRKEMSAELGKRFPKVTPVVGDIQQRTNFADHSFDRIVAIHVLEHLTNLPKALIEMKRLLKPDGFCDFVLPCEGSLAYNIARKISAQRLFERKYKTSYKWFIEREHVSNLDEILFELKNVGFDYKWIKFFPFPLPLQFCNLVVGLQCRIIQ
ncbi:MAG: class I SAM-dependent methyltransferase [Halobacteriovoraceae bacterium]|nr:class I SAM-dependent methyltransferase [Halobacteriovoraceae bacterium]